MKKVFVSFLLAALFVLCGCSAVFIKIEPSPPVKIEPISEAEGLGIYFGDQRISSDFPIKVGEEPLTLTAAFGGALPAKGAHWESSHPDILKVTGDGAACTVELMAAGDYLTITVTADGQQETINIYCVE